MKEKIIKLDPAGQFIGILSTLEEESQKPVIIFLNAGIVHRIGPNRLHVKLARSFASAGFDALRFDMSGLGDSPSGEAGLSYEEQSVLDVKMAVDHMSTLYPDRPIILFGICSGADNGYKAALEDTRIKGLMMLDPYAYQNAGAKISDLAQRAQDPERWKRLVGRLAGGNTAPEEAEEEIHKDDNDRIAPPKEEFGNDLQTISQNGTKLLMLYTSTVRHLINDRAQFFKTFKGFEFGDRITVDVWGDVDHTFTTLASQKRLSTYLVDWLQNNS